MRSALAMTSILGVAAVAVVAGTTHQNAHASGGLYYQRGAYVDAGWLCYGWSNGTYHCTQHWHRNGSGALVSDNPSWVPVFGGASNNASGSAPVTLAAGGHTSPVGAVQASSTSGEPCQSGQYFNGTPSQWQVPPSCYGNVYTPNPANYVYRSGFGWCNWWPEVMNPSRPDLLWGNYPRGTTPRPGATVVFAPGVQGASNAGHYARVVAIAPGGYWMLVSEMNFTWRGAGFGKISYRYVHTGPGISFIY